MAVQKRGDKMSNDERIAVLENTNAHILDSLARIENRLIALDNDMRSGFRDINNQMWSNFKWTLGMMIGGFASMLGIVAHAVHWF